MSSIAQVVIKLNSFKTKQTIITNNAFDVYSIMTKLTHMLSVRSSNSCMVAEIHVRCNAHVGTLAIKRLFGSYSQTCQQNQLHIIVHLLLS